ncbi:Gfo/Idh/MocA family oxidoreductase [Collinsella tanakaei]|uniref:Gfo/Idh/MocA family protein n=1 Tax=Collinsella tanakaei TaxID=626935 RepID=UPI00195EB4D0|nr:Gfo/Idh/MocA family oxidoreductase [Collinsella tanakaei]MBM6755547.1 Gfo/Idh/MocA family oxidoreductase [Collinsella tanakaei]
MVQMTTVRWGIVGAGGIAHRFAKSLERVPGTELRTISCRSEAKAHAFARKFGAKAAYSDVDGPDAGHTALLSDPDIDAVYLALPHGLHRVWAARALAAGKAVLCEKPAALSADEMRAIADTARGCGALFMEAMKARFEPAYRELRRLLDAGAIGEVRRVEVRLLGESDPAALAASSYFFDPVQGGVLLDMGIYCASWLADLLPADLAVTSAECALSRGVDVWVRAELAAPGGASALLECGSDRPGPRSALVVGTEGAIEVNLPHRPDALRVMCPADAEPRELRVPYEVDDFYPQIAHFCELVRAGAAESPIMPLAASVRCAEILDAIRAASRQG